MKPALPFVARPEADQQCRPPTRRFRAGIELNFDIIEPNF
jgi:hypothetical protein